MAYIKFNSYNEFLKYASSLPDDKSKIELIGNYFVHNVSYNYAILIKNKLLSNHLDEMIVLNNTFDGSNEESKKAGLEALKSLLVDETTLVFNNKELMNETIDKLMSLFSHYYGSKDNDGNNITLLKSIKLVSEEVEDDVQDNGLIKYGVCGDYATWIYKCCSDLGIDCKIVTGRDKLLHAWNYINVDSNNVFMDVTKAIHVRDEVDTGNNNTIPSDWFMMDASTMFNLEPGLEIHAIGNYVFDKPVNADNYKELVPSVRH